MTTTILQCKVNCCLGYMSLRTFSLWMRWHNDSLFTASINQDTVAKAALKHLGRLCLLLFKNTAIHNVPRTFFPSSLINFGLSSQFNSNQKVGRAFTPSQGAGTPTRKRSHCVKWMKQCSSLVLPPSPSHPPSHRQQLQTYTTHEQPVRAPHISSLRITQGAHLLCNNLRSGRPSLALYAPLTLTLMMVQAVAGNDFRQTILWLLFFLIEHSSQASHFFVFFCFNCSIR